jgi:hypothetical protein
MMRAFRLMRLVAAFVVASGLSMAVGGPSAAQDDDENGRTAAGNVRDLVLNQREQVLDDIASIMAGDDEGAESTETDADEAVEGEEAEDGEPEDGEGEDGEGEDGEGEDGEGEDGEPEDGEPEDGEGEDEGVGGEDCELAPGGAVGGEEDSAAVASDEAEEDASADEAGAGEEENAESVGGEEDAQPAGGAADTAGDQEVCSLPSTGSGSSDDTHNVLSAFAAFAAVVAAGFGLRQRFI